MASRGVASSRALRGLALLLALLLSVVAAGSAEAKKKDKDKDRKQYTVSESMHKKLTAALEALQAEQYPEAEAVLKGLEGRADRLNPYERALVFQMLGYLESGRERYEPALEYFEKCLAEDALPAGGQISTRYNVAQLYLATEQYEKAARTLEKWFGEVEKPNSMAYYMLAVCYYQLEQVEKALVPAKQAVDLSDQPKEAWLQLLVGLYFEARQYENAVQPLEVLLSVNPKKTYWTQLSNLYAHLGKEKRSLAVMQLAYGQGFLESGRELRQLAQLYLYHQLPYRAGRVLEEGLAAKTIEQDVHAYEMLANSWLLAREYDKSISPLERAAELSPEGNLYARLGQVHLDREGWSEATDALTKALEKGKLDDPGNTNLLIGIAYYHQKQTERARRHFVVATSDESTRESADKWLQLLEREDREANQEG
jgi:tetratricopeptide (TPR) repeat protein